MQSLRFSLFIFLVSISFASAQTPTPPPPPAIDPNSIDVDLKIITHPDGSQSVQWQLVGYTPPPGPATTFPNVDHGEDPIEILPAGTHFHTWAQSDRVERWVSTHGPDTSEMSYLLANGSGMEGGGFYTSIDPIDSINFGPEVDIFITNAPFLIIDPKTLMNLSFVRVTGVQINLLNKANQKLLSLGIKGARYSTGIPSPPGTPPGSQTLTWFNIFSSDVLQNGHEGTLNELLNDLGGRIPSISELISLDSRFHLTPTPELQKSAPLAYQVLNHIPLSDEQWNANFGFNPAVNSPSLNTFQSLIINLAFPNNIIYANKTGSAFMESMVEGNQVRFLTYAKQLFATNPSPFHQLLPPAATTPSFNNYYDSNLISALHVLDMSEAIEQFGPFQFLPNDYTHAPAYVNLKNFVNSSLMSFKDKLIASLELIDYHHDLLTAVAEGNNKPWALYDQAGETHWLEKLMAVNQFQFWGGGVAEFINALNTIHDFFAGAGKGYRTQDAFALGELYPDEKGGFFRVNEIQKKRLLDNPFLTVEQKTDPESQASNPTTLVRYQFASLSHFENYQALLTPAFFNELQGARTNKLLNDPNSASYASYTQKMINDLVTNIITRSMSDISNEKFYLLLKSIQPFQEYNDLSLRFYYKKWTNKPIFLPNWNEALFLSPPEIKYAVSVGYRKYNLLVTALNNEEIANPGFPKYYDLPEWFMLDQNLDQRPKNSEAWTAFQKEIFLKTVRCNTILKNIPNPASAS